MHVIFPAALTAPSRAQRVVRLPLPGADQDRARELHLLPPGSAHREQEGADGGEPGGSGGGGDGRSQGPLHPGRGAQLHG